MKRSRKLFVLACRTCLPTSTQNRPDHTMGLEEAPSILRAQTPLPKANRVHLVAAHAGEITAGLRLNPILSSSDKQTGFECLRK